MRHEREEKGEKTRKGSRPKGKAGQTGAENLGHMQNTEWFQQLRPVLHLVNSFQQNQPGARGGGGGGSTVFGNKNRKGWV